MKITIIGPGAVGLLFAGKLQRTLSNLSLFDHRQERADILNNKGIIFESIDENFEYKVPVETDINKIIDSDLIIIAVKAYHTENIAKILKKFSYRGYALTLQNGYGNTGILKNYLNEDKIIAGITSEGANLTVCNHVRHAGKGKTSFGLISGSNTNIKFLTKIYEIFNNAGFITEISDDTDSLIWSKLIINVGINALTAILNVQNGKLPENEHSTNLMKLLVDEAVNVSKKLNIKLPYNDALNKVKEVCVLTSENYSSMYQDIKNSRKTEIDYINGAVVYEGSKAGIECPVNRAVTGIIHALESFY